jgi:hypothetical protein
LLQDFKVWPVTLTVDFLEHMVEVAQGLVIVDAKEKFQFFHNASTARVTQG